MGGCEAMRGLRARCVSPPPKCISGWLGAPLSLTWSTGRRTALLRGCSSVEPVVLVAMVRRRRPAPPRAEAGGGAALTRR